MSDCMRYTNIQRWEGDGKIVEITNVYIDGVLVRTTKRIGVAVPITDSAREDNH